MLPARRSSFAVCRALLWKQVGVELMATSALAPGQGQAVLPSPPVI